jgi:hypothetical protein
MDSKKITISETHKSKIASHSRDRMYGSTIDCTAITNHRLHSNNKPQNAQQ